MFNAANKTKKIGAAVMLLGAAAVTQFITSCGNAEKDAAAEMVGRSEAMIDLHDYSGAMALLDSVDSRYRSLTDIRRQAMRLRARAIEGMTIDSIATADARLAAARLAVDELAPGFRHIDSSAGLEGYYLPVKDSDKVLTSTCVQGRVSDDGHFYIIANLSGRRIGLNAVEFIDGSERASSPAVSPSRLIAVEGSETISLSPEEALEIGHWLVEHPSASAYELKGSKASVRNKLSADVRSRMIACVRYSDALKELRAASVRREMLERRLQIARDQLANMPLPDSQK